MPDERRRGRLVDAQRRESRLNQWCAKLEPMDTMLLRCFQRQVLTQCHAARVNADVLNQAIANGLDQHVTWAAIQGILTAVANISKAFWGSGGSSAAQRQPLRSSLGVSDSSPVRATSMRNNFDHFDERLDRWWATSKQHNHIDYVVGPDGIIAGADLGDIFRHYNPQTGEVIFWGDRYSLPAIFDEINRIVPLAEVESRRPHWADPLP